MRRSEQDLCLDMKISFYVSECQKTNLMYTLANLKFQIIIPVYKYT